MTRWKSQLNGWGLIGWTTLMNWVGLNRMGKDSNNKGKMLTNVTNTKTIQANAEKSNGRSGVINHVSSVVVLSGRMA